MRSTIDMPPPRRAARRSLNLHTPVMVEIVDDAIAGPNRNRMNITVWIGDPEPDASPDLVARALTIGFLERALESLRAAPATSFVTDGAMAAARNQRADAAAPAAR